MMIRRRWWKRRRIWMEELEEENVWKEWRFWKDFWWRITFFGGHSQHPHSHYHQHYHLTIGKNAKERGWMPAVSPGMMLWESVLFVFVIMMLIMMIMMIMLSWKELDGMELGTSKDVVQFSFRMKDGINFCKSSIKE